MQAVERVQGWRRAGGGVNREAEPPATRQLTPDPPNRAELVAFEGWLDRSARLCCPALLLSRARSKGNPVHRKLLSISFSAILGLAASSALADQFSGEITKLDRNSKSIEVKGGEAERRLRFFLARGGQVTRGGSPVAFADLKRGDRVEVDFTKKGSTHTAQSVAVVAGEASEEIGMRE
jgi:hypothetical protein